MAISGSIHMGVKYGSKWYFNEHTDLTRTESFVASTLLGMAAGALTALFTGPVTCGGDPATGIGMGFLDALFDADFWTVMGGDSEATNVADVADTNKLHFGARYNGVDQFDRPVEADGTGDGAPRYSDTQRPADPTTVTWKSAPQPPPAPEPPAAPAA